MRKLIIAILCPAALAFAAYCACLDVAADAQEKEGEKVSAAEIEKLVKQLGSDGFMIRDKAHKQLLKTPGAVGPLRRALTNKGLSDHARQRIEELLEELDERPGCANGGAPKAEEKKGAQQKVSNEEMESLLKQIGDKDFKVRDRASKRLLQTSGAITALQELVNDSDAERRGRAEALIEQLAPENVKSLISAMVKRKHEAPLDLITEIVTQNRDRIDDNGWRCVFSTIEAIQTHVLANSKTRPKMQDRKNNYAKFKLRHSEARPFDDDQDERRKKLVGARIDERYVTDCALFAASSIQSRRCGHSIVLSNGNTSLKESLGSSFLYTDEDLVVDGRGVFHSMVITRGRVKAAVIEDSIIIENAAESSLVTFFSMATVGLTLAEEKTGLRVEKVMAQSAAERSKFSVGDHIILEAGQGKHQRQMELALRKSLARYGGMILRVRRDGKEFPLTLAQFE